MRKKVALSCTICQNRNYTMVKKTEDPIRLELNKYCKHCEQHTLHRETK